eukprot:1232528-Prymnesium_polylepis.1
MLGVGAARRGDCGGRGDDLRPGEDVAEAALRGRLRRARRHLAHHRRRRHDGRRAVRPTQVSRDGERPGLGHLCDGAGAAAAARGPARALQRVDADVPAPWTARGVDFPAVRGDAKAVRARLSVRTGPRVRGAGLRHALCVCASRSDEAPEARGPVVSLSA